MRHRPDADFIDVLHSDRPAPDRAGKSALYGFLVGSWESTVIAHEENGATRIIPGSHLADRSPEFGQHYDSIPAEMKKGSVLIWHGSLWHGGGANTTGERRVGIAMNYCAGYIRQQENQQLGIPREVAAGFDQRLQQLCGYSVYMGLIGHIDKHDPIELLRGDGSIDMVWDHAST